MGHEDFNEDELDSLLGPKLVQAINDGSKDFDLSDLPIPDLETMQKFKHMNEQEILSEIQRLESEADKLEKKLESLTMEEQAEWDQHIPFSIEKYDKEVEDKMTEYFTKKELQKALEAGEVENVEEDAKLAAHISPELEEFAQKYLEKQDKVNMRMIEKIKEKT